MEFCDLAALLTVPILVKERIILGIWKNYYLYIIQNHARYLNRTVAFPIIARILSKWTSSSWMQSGNMSRIG